MLLNLKSVFWFSLQILSEIFLILRRIQRDMISNVNWCFCTRFCWQILMKIVFYRQIFREIFIYIFFFLEIRQVGAEPFCAGGRADGRTDRHDEANSRFRSFAKASKTMTVRASTRLGNLKGTQFFMFFHLCVSRITVLMFPSTNYLWGAVSRKVRNKFWAEEMPE